LDGQPSEFFLFFEWFAEVKSLVAAACFLSRRAKDLSAPRYLPSSEHTTSLQNKTCSFFSFGKVPGVSVLMYADVSELSIGSIF